jgi:DNA-binding PadR family transcriptional regulator
MVEGGMAFEYASLKVLEILVRKHRTMSVEELRSDLARAGFRFAAGRFEDTLARLREQGLLESLVLAGGEHEALSSVAVTARGERRVRGIVRF